MEAEKNRIEAAVERILEDYERQRDIDKIDLFRRPDKAVIIEMVSKLWRIVFPGYDRDRNYRIYHARHNLSMLAEDVIYNLSHQIALALEAFGAEDAQAEEQGQELCLEFFQRLPAVRALVQTDLEAAYQGDPAATGPDEIIFSYPGLFAVVVYRLAHELHSLKVPIIPRMMTEYAHSETGIDIHPGAQIGDYFFIDHGTGVVIGETAIIGNHVKLYQGVTIGALTTRGGQSLRGQRRHPTIGDQVTIYAGASILGGDTVIGPGCTIGSNVFITASVPAQTTVTSKGQDLQYRMR